MGLPRTFVGFSSANISYYYLMTAWKANENIDFNFTDVQLGDALESDDEVYIKRRCREQITMAGTYALLIGADTYTKTKYVKWEVEVAIEQGCRLIGVNLDNWRKANPLGCPPFFWNIGALFVPFSPHIVAYALEPWLVHPPGDNWLFNDKTYQDKGYALYGDTAFYIPKKKPWER